jgi:hypothetical protein
MDQSELFLERLGRTVEDGGTGRIAIYQSYLKEMSLMSFSELLTGRGFDSGKLLLDKSAHNDWLEALYDFGIIGLILYVALHLFLLKRIFEFIRIKSPLAEPYVVSYAIFFMMSLTSHLIIYPDYFTIMVAFWGMAEGWSNSKSRGLVEGAAQQKLRSSGENCVLPTKSLQRVFIKALIPTYDRHARRLFPNFSADIFCHHRLSKRWEQAAKLACDRYLR